MRVLLDTCVIADALQSRLPFCKEAHKIFLLVANQQFTGYISTKSSTDIYYLIYKEKHSAKESKNVLNRLFSIFDVLDTAGIDCRHAAVSEITDFEDSVMVETAIRTEMDCIVTRNKRDYKESPIPVFTPSEFLKKIKEAYTEKCSTR